MFLSPVGDRSLLFPSWKLAEESIVVRLPVVPHRCRLEVSRAGLQVFPALVIVQRNSQAGSIWNLDVALLDDGLLQPVHQILPEWHIERMVLEREEVARRGGAVYVPHPA